MDTPLGEKGETMMKKTGFLSLLTLILGSFLTLPNASFSAGLPKSIQKALKSLKLDTSILSGLDKELKVPNEWIEGAKKEGIVKIRSTPLNSRERKLFLAPFRERYPAIKVDYFGSNRASRTIKTLSAYKSGRYLSDIVANVGSFSYEFVKAGGVEQLQDIPGFKNPPEGLKDPEGRWVGSFSIYWCLAYNTRLVQKKDLPKKWEDLLTNPIWKNGNLALGNRPNLFAANLWLDKGEHWTKNYLTRMFKELKPQLRKEGMNALPQLAAAGEFYGVIPSHYKSPYNLLKDGAPLGFSCPEPVPAAVGGSAIILKGAPHLNAAKVFLNWLLSKEGQIAQYAATYWTPSHRDLIRPEFLPFADQILGRRHVFINANQMRSFLPELMSFWNDLWLTGGGKSRR